MPTRCSSVTRFLWLFSFAVYVGVMLPPSLNGHICATPEWEGHNEYGAYHKMSSKAFLLGSGSTSRPPNINIFTSFGFAVVLPAMFLTSRFETESQFHTLGCRYAVAVSLQGTAEALKPWLFLTCFQTAGGIAAMFGVLDALNLLFYLASQAVLSQLAVLRLRMVASPQGASRASLLRRVYLLGGVLTAIAVGVTSVQDGLFLVVLIFGVITSLAYIAFSLQAILSFSLAAHDARKEARRNEVLHLSSLGSTDWTTVLNRAFVLALLMIVSAGTTVLWFLMGMLIYVSPGFETFLLYKLSVALDLFCNAGLTLVCAGFVGLWANTEVELQHVGTLVEKRRTRQIQDKLAAALRRSTGPASMIAAMIGGECVDELVRQAVARFRCISWDELQKRPELVLEATTLDGTAAPTELYALSMPCDIADCDMFLSHSWHDDSQQKWDALLSWCEHFRLEHGRAPTLWFDKTCINQATIADDLRCLPIFLAACNGMLIISGTTYTSRLWCVLELFVYINMLEADETRGMPLIIPLGQTHEAREAVNNGWISFDAALCECFKEEDKSRIMKVVESCQGGIQEFNQNVRWLAAELLQGMCTLSSLSSSATNIFSLASCHAVSEENTKTIKSVPPEEEIVENCVSDLDELLRTTADFRVRQQPLVKEDGIEKDLDEWLRVIADGSVEQQPLEQNENYGEDIDKCLRTIAQDSVRQQPAAI